MPTQLVKLALIDSSPLTSSTVQDHEVFSIYQEGALDASRQVMSIEANTALVENNREVITSKVYTIDVVGLYNQAKRSTLQTWASDRQPLYLIGYGLDGSILQAYGAITVVSGFDQNASFKFRFQTEAKGGYDSATSVHTSSMSYSRNGFALWTFEESPQGASFLPESSQTRLVSPYTSDSDLPPSSSASVLSSGDPSASWSGDAWRVECDADDTYYMYFHRWFPFGGVKLNFSINLNVAAAGTGVKLFLQTLKNSAGSIQQESTSFFTSGSQRRNVTIDSTSSETQFIRCIIRVDNSTTALIKETMLWIGNTEPTFTEFNT